MADVVRYFQKSKIYFRVLRLEDTYPSFISNKIKPSRTYVIICSDSSMSSDLLFMQRVRGQKAQIIVL